MTSEITGLSWTRRNALFRLLLIGTVVVLMVLMLLMQRLNGINKVLVPNGQERLAEAGAATTTTTTTQGTSPAVHATKQRKKAAMCIFVVNEELYLDEFVNYHHALGFEKFFIYDSSEGFELKQWGRLKGNFVDVDVFHFPGGGEQHKKAFIDCGSKAKASRNYEWAAFFDADEYLVLKQHEHVSDMLEEYCHQGALVVNWLTFKSNGWNLPVFEPITRRFVYHMPLDSGVNRHVKTIARLADVDSLFLPRDSTVDLALKSPHNIAIVRPGTNVHDTTGKIVRGPFNTGEGIWDVVALHHYQTKSAKEFVQRKRGQVGRNEPKKLEIAERQFAKDLARDHLPLDAGEAAEQNLVFNDSAWQFLKKRVPAYALFDELALVP